MDTQGPNAEELPDQPGPVDEPSMSMKGLMNGVKNALAMKKNEPVKLDPDAVMRELDKVLAAFQAQHQALGIVCVMAWPTKEGLYCAATGRAPSRSTAIQMYLQGAQITANTMEQQMGQMAQMLQSLQPPPGQAPAIIVPPSVEKAE
jgi:hypothetical protein